MLRSIVVQQRTLGAALALLLSLAATPAVAQDAPTVSMQSYSFQPTELHVAPGATVVWNNDDSMGHTVTADDGSFDLAQFSQGKSVSHTFSTSGTFAYHCAIHSYMHGKIIVLAAGVAPPATDTAPETPGGSGTTSLLLVALGVLFLGVAAFVARRTSRA